MAETTEQQTASTEAPAGGQHSQAFLEKMGSISAAQEGIRTSTFDSTEKPFDLEAAQQAGTQTTEQPTEAPPTTEQPVVQSTEQPQTTEQPAQTTEAPAQTAEQTTEQPTTEQTATTEESSQQLVVENPIIGKMTIGEQAQQEDQTHQSFDTVEDWNQFLEGIDAGLTPENISQELPKIIERSNNFETVSQKMEGYENLLKQIPGELYKGIEAWSQGEDWRAQVAQAANAVDYETEFGKHDPKQMVERYSPGKLTTEDWEEFEDRDGDPDVKARVEEYLSLSEGKFNLEKKEYDLTKQTYEQNAERFVQMKQESFDKSREHALSTFNEAGMPVEESYIANVDKTMNDEMILSIFKNPDGTYKDNCHTSLIMAQDGFGLVKSLYDATKREIVSQVRTEVLDRTGDSPSVTKGGQAELTEQQRSEEDIRKYVEKMAGAGATQSSTYG